MASISAMMVATMPAAAQPVQRDAQAREFNISEQPLNNALMQLARQANIGVFVPTDLVRGRKAPAVRGVVTPEQVLDRLAQKFRPHL